MKDPKLAVLLVFAIFMVMLIPQGQALLGNVTVTVTPSSQVAQQSSVATYTVTVSDTFAPGLDVAFTLSLSGAPHGASASFSDNPLSVPSPGSATTTLTINTGSYGNGAGSLSCPGSYSFTVTAIDSTSDSGSGSASLVITQSGQPLSVTVSTDKSTYTVGQPVTILVSVNRPSEGLLTISPPTGTPITINYPYISTSTPQTFQTTNRPIGRWTITFQADDFCGFSNNAVAYFDLTPNTYDVSVSLSGVPASVNVSVQVDGQSQGSMTGTEIKTLSFALNTQHTLNVDQYVAGDQGVRYYAQQNTWTVSSGGSHTFNYQTQYYFTVATDPDGITTVSGSGWYNAGTTVQTNTAPQNINGTSGTRYAFKGWLIDGAVQSGNPVSLTLDKPHKAVAKYNTQYQLIVDSAGGVGNPQGSGFYDAGSTAQFSVTSPSGILVQQVFAGWTGDYSGTTAQGSIVMDKAHAVHATWTTSYVQLFLVAGVAAAVAVVAFLLLWRKRRNSRTVTKPAPTPVPSEKGGTEAVVAPTNETATDKAEIVCTSCGTANPVGTIYCTECGAKLS